MVEVFPPKIGAPAVPALAAPGAPPAEASPVDGYLAGLDAAPRACLDALRSTLRTVLPHAEEAIKYAMPAMVLDGVAVAGYAAFRDHCGYFPMSGSVIDAAGDAIDRFPRSKGGFRFGFEERLPVALVRRLVKLRLAELAAVTNGTRREYYDDGQAKAVGPMKAGALHGSWQWFRRDGTLLRTGQFSHGREVGTWTTWNRDGTAAKVTHRSR